MKPMLLPRSKLVRDPASFGYRRLLLFLNQMVANNGTTSHPPPQLPNLISLCGLMRLTGSDISKNVPSEAKVFVPNKEVCRSDTGVTEESVNGRQAGADPMEQLAAEGGADREMKDCGDTATIREEAKTVPSDPAASKPLLQRMFGCILYT